MKKAANAFQAGRYEQHTWRSTIRAQRAIRGEDADALAFTRQNEINAVLRASKTICEVAACEAPTTGGLEPARTNLDEMFAKALLLFGNGQLFAAIRGGLIKPELRISPCGDVLSEREIFSKLLEPSASWLNRRVLNQADNSYDKKSAAEESDKNGDQVLPWGDELRTAIQAEYGCSAEAFFDFQFAVLQMAEQRNQGIFTAKLSELRRTLRENAAYPDDDTAGLLQRLTLESRNDWQAELPESEIDTSKFDRPFSLINRPLLALNADEDPEVLLVPAFVSDAILYAVSGLYEGRLGEKYWRSPEARSFAG